MAGQCKELKKDGVRDFLAQFDTVLFDCDGVLWLTSAIIPKAPEAAELLKKHGKRVFYITNNSTSTRSDYLKKMQKLGFQAELDEVVCTAHVAANYLKRINFTDKVYLIGEKAMEKELDDFGIRWTKHADENVSRDSFETVGTTCVSDQEVKCVLVGADLSFNYEKLTRACLYLYNNDDCLFLATNCDPQFPLKDGRKIPGTGSMVQAVATAAGREPVWMGKPEKTIYDFLHHTHNIDPARTLMVGDRLGTDIKLAKNNHLLSMLVLTGMHNLTHVEEKRQSDNPDERQLVPDYYIESVTKLAEFLSDL